MFVIGIINTTGWYVYIWISVMEPSVNSDVHLICQLPNAFQRNFQVTTWSYLNRIMLKPVVPLMLCLGVPLQKIHWI